MSLPEKIYKGALLNFTESNSDYPASDGWTLKYALINATTKIVLSSTADGDDHLFNIETADQSEWTAGKYTCQKYVTKDGESHVLITTDKTEIIPFFADEDTYDARSYAQKMLDAIEALLEDRSASLDYEYSYKGKTLRSMQFEELIKARIFFAQEVYREEQKAALDNEEEVPGRIYLGFE